MHVGASPFIRSTFEYLMLKAPGWSKKDCLAAICFDELYIDQSCDIDKILDKAINPKNGKNANIIMIRSLCGSWKFPFFCQVDHAITKNDIMRAISAFEACGITVLCTTCDQGTVQWTIYYFSFTKICLVWS